MATCERKAQFISLDMPAEFEDLEGLLQADMQAIVAMLATRAHERLFLTRREFQGLQEALWNKMADAINETMTPLSVENR